MGIANRVFVIGGPGTQADAHADNAGGFDSASITYANSQGANGGPLHDVTSGAITDAGGGSINISKTGEFAVALAGNFLYLDNAASHATGRYLVTASNADFVRIELAHGGNETCDVRVGGALDNTGNSVLAAYTLASTDGNKVKICVDNTGSATVIVPGTIAINTNDNVIIEGCDNDGVRLLPGVERPIILETADTPDGIFKVANGVNNMDWYSLDMDGGGNGKGEHCIFCVEVFSDNHRFFNCTFHNTEDELFKWFSDKTALCNCEFHGADQQGGDVYAASIQNSDGIVLGCSFHDNNGGGLQVSRKSVNIIANLFYNNGSIGLDLQDISDLALCAYNTVFGNGGVGIFIHTDGDNVKCFNNTSSNNVGFNWDLDGDDGHFIYFAYNHSYGGGGLVTDGFGWANTGQGNNITGDPNFAGQLIGTDLAASDHAGPAYTVTSASGAFRSGMVGNKLVMLDTGTGGHFTKGLYEVAAFVSETEITLTSDPTDGTNETAGDYFYIDDPTPTHGSALLAAGTPRAFATNAGPFAITNYQDIGALSRQEPKRYPRPVMMHAGN